DALRDSRTNIITDLKPESHQLGLFRSELLKITDAGVFDHALAAFWYFVLISEILLTIRRNEEWRSKRYYDAFDVIAKIDRAFYGFDAIERGDFTTRLNRLSNVILQEIAGL